MEKYMAERDLDREWKDIKKRRQARAARRYRKRHPAVVMVERCRAFADLEKVPFDISREDIRTPSQCPVLGIPMGVKMGSRDNAMTVIPIDQDKGYVRGNVMVVSSRARARIVDAADAEELRYVADFCEAEKVKRPSRRYVAYLEDNPTTKKIKLKSLGARDE